MKHCLHRVLWSLWLTMRCLLSRMIPVICSELGLERPSILPFLFNFFLAIFLFVFHDVLSFFSQFFFILTFPPLPFFFAFLLFVSELGLDFPRSRLLPKDIKTLLNQTEIKNYKMVCFLFFFLSCYRRPLLSLADSQAPSSHFIISGSHVRTLHLTPSFLFHIHLKD